MMAVEDETDLTPSQSPALCPSGIHPPSRSGKAEREGTALRQDGAPAAVVLATQGPDREAHHGHSESPSSPLPEGKGARGLGSPASAGTIRSSGASGVR